MRTFICVYFLVGIVITLIICKKTGIIEDIKSGKYSIAVSVFGIILCSLFTPISIAWGLVDCVLAKLSNK